MHNTTIIKTKISNITNNILTLQPKILFHLFNEDQTLLNESLQHILTDCEPLKSINLTPIELDFEEIVAETDLELSKELLEELDLTELETFLIEVGDIINSAYHKSDLDISTFITERKETLPTVLLNMVASEQAFGIDPNSMDSLLEVRTNLLNMDIITEETNDIYAIFELIDSDIKYLNDIGVENISSQGYIAEGLNFEISNKSIIAEKFEDIFILYQKAIKLLLYKINNKYQIMKKRIIEIDQIVQEIPKLVGTAGLFTKLTPKKQMTASKNYTTGSIESEVAETYMQFSNLENNPSKNMQDTLIKMKKLKQYDSKIIEITLG